MMADKWESAQAVFASQDASPAARRLSLTLNFASHIVAPHLEVDVASEHSRLSYRLPPGQILQLLQVYLQELSSLTATDRVDISKRERFVYAMVICLFVVLPYRNFNDYYTQDYKPRSPKSRFTKRILHIPFNP